MKRYILLLIIGISFLSLSLLVTEAKSSSVGDSQKGKVDRSEKTEGLKETNPFGSDSNIVPPKKEPFDANGIIKGMIAAYENNKVMEFFKLNELWDRRIDQSIEVAEKQAEVFKQRGIDIIPNVHSALVARRDFGLKIDDNNLKKFMDVFAKSQISAHSRKDSLQNGNNQSHQRKESSEDHLADYSKKLNALGGIIEFELGIRKDLSQDKEKAKKWRYLWYEAQSKQIKKISAKEEAFRRDMAFQLYDSIGMFEIDEEKKNQRMDRFYESEDPDPIDPDKDESLREWIFDSLIASEKWLELAKKGIIDEEVFKLVTRSRSLSEEEEALKRIQEYEKKYRMKALEGSFRGISFDKNEVGQCNVNSGMNKISQITNLKDQVIEVFEVLSGREQLQSVANSHLSL